MSEAQATTDVAPAAAESGPGSSSPNPASSSAAQQAAPTGSIYDAVASQAADVVDPQKAADPVANQSNRPDFLHEKYSSIEDQAKAYNELSKKFGEFKGAPEKYNFDKLPATVDKESPLVKGMADFFQKKNLSQEGFEEAVSMFAQITEQYSEANPKQILEELGPTGKDIIGRVGNWIKNFNPEEQALFHEMSLSAKHIQLLDKVRAGTTLSRAPTNADIQSSYGHETLKAVEAEKAQNWDRYRNDPAYASELSRRYQDAAMREGYSQESFAEMKRR